MGRSAPVGSTESMTTALEPRDLTSHLARLMTAVFTNGGSAETVVPPAWVKARFAVSGTTAEPMT